MSRITIREALLRLEAEGLVTISPHRGAVVTQLSADEVAELFELRGVARAVAAAPVRPRC